MSQRIYRSLHEPIREGLSLDERWNGPDNGLIWCWELGRKRSQEEPDLALRARNGELPYLKWKGHADQTKEEEESEKKSDKKIKKKLKYGCFYYLAEWQGLRGDDLNIDLSVETEITSTKSGIKVIYTGDRAKYAKDERLR